MEVTIHFYISVFKKRGSVLKKLKYIQLFAFLAIVGGLSIGSFVAKDREFSDNENRYLAKPPKL